MDALRRYLGAKAGFYFAFMSHYSSWLRAPAALGLLATAAQQWGAPELAAAATSAYALLAASWGALMLRAWQRREATLAFEWGCSDFERAEHVRPAFRGALRASPVTGQPEKHFPAAARALRQAAGAVAVAAMLGAALAVMFCMLNLNGPARASCGCAAEEGPADAPLLPRRLRGSRLASLHCRAQRVRHG